MQRAIVLSMFAVLGTAASAVAQDATDAQPDAESAPAAEPLSPPLVPIGAPVVQPETGKRRPAAKPARPKKGRLPRLDPKRNEKEFQRKLALAQDLHVQDRCGAAYPMYLDLQEQRPDHPDVLKGIGLCGIATARFPELGADVRRQRLLDVKAALDTYAARPDATPAEHAIAAYARRQIGEIEQQFAASTPAAPTSAPEVREFPRQKGATTLCGMQAFWDPNQGLNPGFVAELFTLLHADPELRVTIWLPADLNDRVRQLFRTTNDLWLKDQGFCERHGLTSTVLREYASYERRVGFIGAPGAEQQPSRVMLHHPNGIDVAIQRCDAARGALAWAAEEDQRRKQQAISTRIAEGGANREALPAPATVVAATPGAVTPPAPPLVVASPPPPPAILDIPESAFSRKPSPHPSFPD